MDPSLTIRPRSNQYSTSATTASCAPLEESLKRLGVDRIDILHIHDPDAHWKEAIESAYPALERLRAEGVINAVSAGMNQWEMLARLHAK